MSFKYNYAIMRSVPDSLITKGKAKNLNLEFLRREQQNLAEVLDKCGVRVVTLETDTNYPECCFVEDCAVIVGETALICRPADQSRRGEVKNFFFFFLKFKYLFFFPLIKMLHDFVFKSFFMWYALLLIFLFFFLKLVSF